jgi:hypothetical protein
MWYGLFRCRRAKQASIGYPTLARHYHRQRPAARAQLASEGLIVWCGGTLLHTIVFVHLYHHHALAHVCLCGIPLFQRYVAGHLLTAERIEPSDDAEIVSRDRSERAVELANVAVQAPMATTRPRTGNDRISHAHDSIRVAITLLTYLPSGGSRKIDRRPCLRSAYRFGDSIGNND